MTEFIPGENARINIVANDSSLLVDSYSGYITGSTLDAEGQIMVDVNTGKIKGKQLIGDVYSNDGKKKILNVSHTGSEATIDADILGSIKGNVVANDDTVLVNTTSQHGDFKTLNVDTLTVTAWMGDTFGKHKGLIDAPDKGAIVQSLNAQVIVGTDVTANSFHSNDMTGNLVGTFDGDSVGKFTGKMYGELNGTFNGTGTGTWTGDLTGDITDTNGIKIFTYDDTNKKFEINGIIKHKSGSVALDTSYDDTNALFNGLVSGAYIDSAGKKLLEDQPTGGTIIDSPTTKKVQIGHTDNAVELNEFLTSKVEKYAVETLSSQHKTLAHRGTAQSPTAVKQRDHLYMVASWGHDGNDYKWAGAWGMFQDDIKTHNTSSSNMPGKFGVSCSDGVNPPMLDADTTLTFDGDGVLKVKVCQVGELSSSERDAVSSKTGMIIFNKSTGKFQGYTGTKWVDLH